MNELATHYYNKLQELGFVPKYRVRGRIWFQNSKGLRVLYCAPCMFLKYNEKVYRYGKAADELITKLMQS